MKKWFLSLALFLSSWALQAHQTEISSTMLVEQDNNTWVLQIRSALTAFDQTIQANYPKYESAEEFQVLVLEHLKKNIQITFNGQDPVTLQNGMVKLGHESSVIFEVLGVPENIESVYVTNSSFQSVSRSQSALILLKKGFKKKQFILNKKNGYGLHLLATNNQFTPLDPSIATSKPISNYSLYYLRGIVGLIGLFAIALLWIRRNRTNIKQKMIKNSDLTEYKS